MLIAVICLSISTAILLFWATFAILVAIVNKENAYDEKMTRRGQETRHRTELFISHNATKKYKALFELHRDKSTALRQRIFEMKEKEEN